MVRAAVEQGKSGDALIGDEKGGRWWGMDKRHCGPFIGARHCVEEGQNRDSSRRMGV
jgi:hypothetical protein